MPGTKFTNAQLAILEKALPEYREISGKNKKSQKDTIATPMAKLTVSVKNWLANRARAHKTEDAFFKKISWYSVFLSMKSEDIKKEAAKLTSIAPGMPGYVSFHRKAASTLTSQVTAEEMEEYQSLAEEWNTKGVPKDVQMKEIQRHLAPFLWQLTESMFGRFGIRMIMLWGYENDQGVIVQGHHDHNDRLDGPAFTKTHKDWLDEPIGANWQGYLVNVFKGASADAPVHSTKDPLRVLGSAKAKVPWKQIHGDLSQFVDPDGDFLPDDVVIQDPSHMLQDHVTRILHHWKARQDAASADVTFKFKASLAPSSAQEATQKETPRKPCGAVALPSPPETDRSPRPTKTKQKLSKSTVIPTSTPSRQSSDDDSDGDDAEALPSLPARQRSTKAGSPGSLHHAHEDFEHQIEFLKTLSDETDFKDMVQKLCLALANETKLDIKIPGNVNWNHKSFSLGPASHKWSLVHIELFGADIFCQFGKPQGQPSLLRYALFAGMLLRDHDVLSGKVDLTDTYPSIPKGLKGAGKVIATEAIDNHILPWCHQVAQLLQEVRSKSILARPLGSPADAKGSWVKTQEFLFSLSSQADYRKLVMRLDMLEDGDEHIGDSIPSEFSWDSKLHHVGEDIHRWPHTWLKKILKVKTSPTNGPTHRRDFMALHTMFLGMILRGIQMSKSINKVTCAYPSIPAGIINTGVSAADINTMYEWCTARSLEIKLPLPKTSRSAHRVSVVITKSAPGQDTMSSPLVKIGPPGGIHCRIRSSGVPGVTAKRRRESVDSNDSDRVPKQARQRDDHVRAGDSASAASKSRHRTRGHV
ncbi:hypothetical protein HYDPIDRAFT_33139 [Hydnomerulius pinastri MD-312]|uniref:Uncharacterized protein n=1 Tax=Hydnomerulius pinastri MD-312 TaxID=994086 RepID=A0A0C9V2P1_9AGAM|nr:hypothetical protein HYDPIDRAFT_33139 [Hydnomerulius pinastri MD-312]